MIFFSVLIFCPTARFWYMAKSKHILINEKKKMNLRHSWCTEQEHNTWIMMIERQSSSKPLPLFHIFINIMMMMMNPADKMNLFAFACLQRLMTNTYWYLSVYITWNQNKNHICGACSQCSKERARFADSSVWWYRTWRHWITVSLWCVQCRLEIIHCGSGQQIKNLAH